MVELQKEIAGRAPPIAVVVNNARASLSIRCTRRRQLIANLHWFAAHILRIHTVMAASTPRRLIGATVLGFGLGVAIGFVLGGPSGHNFPITVAILAAASLLAGLLAEPEPAAFVALACAIGSLVPEVLGIAGDISRDRGSHNLLGIELFFYAGMVAIPVIAGCAVGAGARAILAWIARRLKARRPPN